jgi:1-deoxy-D-xylulose-5-phosphate reductoisomerase
MTMKNITLLGSTGSIGGNVLDVVRQFPDRYKVVAMAAGSNVQRLATQVDEFSPDLVAVCDAARAKELKALLPPKSPTRIVIGEEGNIQVATHPLARLTVSAMVGAVGLRPTLAAIDAGKDIGLANKETLVMAGKIVMQAVRDRGVHLLPIDSEHSAILQALDAGRREDLDKIILTASGGPFFGRTRDQLSAVTCAEALQHPNWSMGKKITIDSATLMNKGLEVIEARWLFDIPESAIEVVVHPQSIVHSLVRYRDGSVLAQLGIPDMRIPIAYALSYPERLPLDLPPLNLADYAKLQFFPPDATSFPALLLAFSALARGGVSPAVLNAANEVAVDAFLAGRIGFLQITETVAQTMDMVSEGSDDSLTDILRADENARQVARQIIDSRSVQ